jgi:hypothetical protein
VAEPVPLAPVTAGVLAGTEGAVVELTVDGCRGDECRVVGRVVWLLVVLGGELCGDEDALPPTGVLGVMRKVVLA